MVRDLLKIRILAKKHNLRRVFFEGIVIYEKFLRGKKILKNIQNELIKTLDKCKICGRLWDEEENCIKSPNFNYKINEFVCKDCDKNFDEWR